MRRPLFLAAALAALTFGPGASAQTPAEALAETEEHLALCRELGGTPRMLDGYVTVSDLNGDGLPDFIYDLAQMECVNAASAFCGSAGCPVSAWLSRREGGFEAFRFGYLQGFEIVEGPGLPAVVASYHGTACGENRSGADGCTRRWVFVTNQPEEPKPEMAEARAGAPTAQAPVPEEQNEAAAPEEAAEPVPPGWTLRAVSGSDPVAVGGGPGGVQSLAAFCLSGQPWLSIAFTEPPVAEVVQVVFGFSTQNYAAQARREETAGGAFVIALEDQPLAGLLAGRDSEARLSVDGTDLGVLSLSGSTRAIRAALENCQEF